MDKILEDNSQVVGQIYLITNKQTNKQYVGQTLSHRKNHNKYRPFGYIGRFKDHISEALCNTKKKQCTYLNNAIRLYGKDEFTVELITVCPKENLDIYEEKYIQEYNSLYPNGYNLTTGGKIFKNIKTDIEQNNPTITTKKRGGSISRSSETRTKMSNSLKQIMNTPQIRQELMLRTQKQHSESKIANFKNVNIDLDKIEQYIKIRNKKDGSKFIKIIVGNKQTSFVGKFNTLEELKERAIQFLKSINSFATLPNCSGNP
jgi:Putative endonuclease segE, GIY-YIG domain